MIYRFKVVCFFVLILVAGCSPVTSEYFTSTKYIKSFNTFVVNDSLRLSLKTPADIYYEKDEKKLIKEIKQEDKHLSGVIAYGKTQVPPHYKIFIMLDPKKKVKAFGPTQIVKDTLLDNHRFLILCQSKDVKNLHSYREDCQEIFHSVSTGRDYRKEIASLFDVSKQYGNRYYQGLDRIENYPAKGRNEKWLQLQMALNYASFLAPNDVYNSLLQKFNKGSTRASIKRIIKSKAIQDSAKVLRTLIEEAKHKQLVMFNENHFYPQHRILVTQLLDTLKKDGFDYLALEALGKGQDSLLNAGKPPTIESGFYTKEPHFAQLIRKAQEFGFTFVSYENTDPDKKREYGQAYNLYQKIFAKDKSAKVVVLAGLDHILEQQTENNRKWLGFILNKKYSIDPLTISQSHLNRYRKMGSPIALIQGRNFKQKPYRSVDWLLLNNLSVKSHSTNYHYLNPYKKQVQISLFLASELNAKHDFRSFIPFRSGLVMPEKTIGFELLNKEYLRVIYDEKGNILETEKISHEAVK